MIKLKNLATKHLENIKFIDKQKMKYLIMKEIIKLIIE